jgi:uncharacterized membrane-anchored protein
MTAARRNLWLGIIVVATVQASVLCWMIYERAHLLSSGREIVLEVVPVDPRSLFQGDYVTLSYPISRVDTPSGRQLRRGTVIYVTLQRSANDTWTVAQTSTTPPAATSPNQIVLKGRVQYFSAATDRTPAQSSVDYGIETFFVPEGAGHEIEKLIGNHKLFALIAVDGDGNAGIKGLIVDGKRVYEEPLL